MGILDRFRRKEPNKDEIRFIGDFLLAKYSFEEYCKFFKVNGLEAEKEYNAYQDRRSWLISGHEKRGGKVVEVTLYYDEYLAYLKKHKLPDNENSQQLYMFSKPKLDMENALSGIGAEKLVKEFIELTSPEVTSAKMFQWLYDNWERIDKDFLVLLSRYIKTAEVEGQKEISTRLTAHKQVIDALKSKPDDLSFAERLCLVADASMREGSLDQAISQYSHVIAIDHKLAVAYCNRGTAYTKKGQHDLAITDYTKAITLDSQQAIPYHGRGTAYYRKGDYERAIADYNTAISLDHEFAEAYNDRGNAYQQHQQTENHYDLAIADYSKAISLDPDFAYAYANRGSMYKLLGRYDEAVKDFKSFISLSKDTQMIELGEQHIRECIKKGQSSTRAEELVEEFIELTKPDKRKAKVAVTQISRWLYDNWDRIDNDFLVLLSQYIEAAEVKGQKEISTRLTAHKQVIDALKTNPPTLAKLIIKKAISSAKDLE
jgi:tetratricopeptide (TPR) repeat protein